jgi:hypothetical protein
MATVPKRSDQRRRRNAGAPVDRAAGAARVRVPAADRGWHPVALRWYRSLRSSGQAAFYEPSDWALAYVLAESLSRDLGDKFVGFTKAGEAVTARLPIPAGSLTAYLRGMTALLATEGDRRRLRLELDRPGDEDDAAPTVSWLDDARDRVTG